MESQMTIPQILEAVKAGTLEPRDALFDILAVFAEVDLAAFGSRVDRLVFEHAMKKRRQVFDLEKENAAIREAFAKRAKHDNLCAMAGGYGYCNCGLYDYFPKNHGVTK